MLRENILEDGNALLARYTISVKSNADGEKTWRVRHVIGEDHDKLIGSMVHPSQNLQTFSVRL